MTGKSRIDHARQLLLAGDIAAARRVCEACLPAPVDAKELAGAHLILAACCRGESDPVAMLAHAASAVAATPGDALAHYALAECSMNRGQTARYQGARSRDRVSEMVQAIVTSALLLDAGKANLVTTA
jgi:hypothetical protein